MEEGNPSKILTFKPKTKIPIDVTEREGKRRRGGRPRETWVETSLDNLWNLVKQEN